jgi:prolyl-tRNA synthetase
VASHQLLVQAGFIRQLAAGVYTALPLGLRSLTRLEAILREEMARIGGQEIRMPVVHPAEIWQESGRWYEIGDEMGRFVDRAGRDMVLAMTHEEVVADLVRSEIQSYRQLPALVYHIQTKWRDDPRPRAGLIRVREFSMLDSYSLDTDDAGLDAQYAAHYAAYERIFRRCGLPAIAVESDTGMMGGAAAHEFMVLTPVGEDTIILCDACGYTANRQVAVAAPPASLAPDAATGASVPGQLPLARVATPDARTIAEVAASLGIAPADTAKTLFLSATVGTGDAHVEELVLAVVRGDMEVNETKLAHVLGAKALRPATAEALADVGIVPGFGSPVGLEDRSRAVVVVDNTVAASANLVVGANEDGFHFRNANLGRDYTADIVGDIRAVTAGDACRRCGGALRAERGVEVGNIFKLGTRYSESMGCRFVDNAGAELPVVMGSYGLGVGRALACVAEIHHDEGGLVWPASVSPFDVHLVALRGAEVEAERVYGELAAAGLDCLLDDRDERPGVKFNDADLIGVPLRVTIGPRSLEGGGAEMKLRRDDTVDVVAIADVAAAARHRVDALLAELDVEHVGGAAARPAESRP